MSSLQRLPKKQRPKATCCGDKPACKRCPLVMLRDGTLPDGYTVRRRKLVKVKAPKRRRPIKIAA